MAGSGMGGQGVGWQRHGRAGCWVAAAWPGRVLGGSGMAGQGVGVADVCPWWLLGLQLYCALPYIRSHTAGHVCVSSKSSSCIDGFRYDPPVVTAISPTVLQQNEPASITLSGHSFGAARSVSVSVTVGQKPCESIVFVSATSIECRLQSLGWYQTGMLSLTIGVSSAVVLPSVEFRIIGQSSFAAQLNQRLVEVGDGGLDSDDLQHQTQQMVLAALTAVGVDKASSDELKPMTAQQLAELLATSATSAGELSPMTVDVGVAAALRLAVLIAQGDSSAARELVATGMIVNDAEYQVSKQFVAVDAARVTSLTLNNDAGYRDGDGSQVAL